jgi:cyanate permease
MPHQPRQSPKREKGYYEAVLREWRVAGVMRGLTDAETILLGAQFTGLAVAMADVTPPEHEAQLGVATRAMHTAYSGRMAVKHGFGIPMTPPLETDS